MDTYTFIASIVGSLAWPFTLLATIFVIVRHGQKIATIVHSIKFKDIELTLRDNFEKAKIISDEIRIASDPTPEGEADFRSENEIIKLASIDPGVAILKSWQKLEAKLIQLIQHNGLMRFTNADNFVQRLLELQKLSPKDIELFHWLKRIRNDAVHVHDRQKSLTMAEVYEFDQFVEAFVRRLEQIRNEPGYIDAE